MTNTDPVKAAIEAKNSSYSPYSKFRVGAALVTSDNNIFTGANIENSSFSLTICAERVAFVKALTEGAKKFSKVYVATDQTEFVTPCGACRQFMMEFAPELEVILIIADGSQKKYLLKDLIPECFNLKH